MPFPVNLSQPVEPILAVGGELKATFCITKERHAYMGPHVGDMINLETLTAFEAAVARFLHLFRIKPEGIACDLHPAYLSSQWATSALEKRPLIKVQHHHAHLAALMAEHQIKDEPLIGFTFDGTGYGDDGAIWGGEVLIADYASYHRAYHLDYVPLAGGNVTVARPYRMALAHLYAAGLNWDQALPPMQACPSEEQALYRQQLLKEINSVPTSSIGRLFDAVAALIGLRERVTYEGQAAIELESIVDPHETGAYRFDIQSTDLFSAVPVIEEIVKDLSQGVRSPVIAARFHNGLSQLIRELANRLRQQTGIRRVGLSGGVFQNMLLLAQTIDLLERDNFDVLTHHLVPPNDGGLALGQAIVAAHQLG